MQDLGSRRLRVWDVGLQLGFRVRVACRNKQQRPSLNEHAKYLLCSEMFGFKAAFLKLRF